MTIPAPKPAPTIKLEKRRKGKIDVQFAYIIFFVNKNGIGQETAHFESNISIFQKLHTCRCKLQQLSLRNYPKTLDLYEGRHTFAFRNHGLHHNGYLNKLLTSFCCLQQDHIGTMTPMDPSHHKEFHHNPYLEIVNKSIKILMVFVRIYIMSKFLKSRLINAIIYYQCKTYQWNTMKKLCPLIQCH